jgi:hypothetical protein
MFNKYNELDKRLIKILSYAKSLNFEIIALWSPEYQNILWKELEPNIEPKARLGVDIFHNKFGYKIIKNQAIRKN